MNNSGILRKVSSYGEKKVKDGRIELKTERKKEAEVIH